MSLIGELKRRNVFRAAGAYVVLAWIAIQVIETIFPVFGFDDSAIRISVIILAIGFLPVVVLAWAFELTPDGLKHESNVNYSSPGFQKFGKRIDRLVTVLLVLALVYFAFDKFILSSEREDTLNQQKIEEIAAAHKKGRTEALVESYGEKSIAVLPFVNMSDDAANEFFSDGISEELLNLLTKIPELRVTSRSSAFAFKDEKIDIPTVAERLNVAHILEGSVRKVGNQVRITAQLIEARSDTHLWSETYDRQLDDIFAIQDEIAATVVAQLKITLLGAVPKVKDTDPEAYSLFLRARHLAHLNTAENWEQSNALYERVLAIDPDYAAAWGGLATNYRSQASHGLVPADEGFSLVRKAAERALAIDPDYAPAHANLGRVAMVYDNDLTQTVRHFERALQLDPANISIIRDAAVLLQNLGHLNESIALLEFVSARDPVNPIGFGNLGISYLYAGRWDEAIAALQTSLRLSPDYMGAHYWTGIALLFKGEAEAALELIAMKEDDEEYRVKGMTLALHTLGRQEEYLAKLAVLIEQWGNEWPSEVAHVYAYIGDADAAFQWLDKAIEQNEDGLSEQFQQPFYTPLHDDPRWTVFLERVGSTLEQLNAIEFQVNLPK